MLGQIVNPSGVMDARGPRGLVGRPGRPSDLYIVHLAREFAGGKDPLPEQNIGEGHDPALVVGQLADHFGAEGLDTATLLFGVDDLVKVEDVGKRVAALLPRLEFMIDALDGLGGQTADVVRQALHEVLRLGHCVVLPVSMVTGATPIIVSRVTRAASCSSL